MKIIHIGQLHKTPASELTPDIFEAVVASQYEVAKIIKADNKYPVVLEDLENDLNSATTVLDAKPIDEMKAYAKSVFPTGRSFRFTQ